MTCRVCREEDAPPAPCACRGETGRVHAACLEEWRARQRLEGRDADRCEICGEPYGRAARRTARPLLDFVLRGVWPRRLDAWMRRALKFSFWATAFLACLLLIPFLDDAFPLVASALARVYSYGVSAAALLMQLANSPRLTLAALALACAIWTPPRILCELVILSAAIDFLGPMAWRAFKAHAVAEALRAIPPLDPR